MSVTDKAVETESSLTINARALNLTDERFFNLCQDNRNLRLELNAQGELIIMGPTATETGRRNANLNFQLYLWARQMARACASIHQQVLPCPTGQKFPPMLHG
jgi:Uma2 family endonuclease